MWGGDNLAIDLLFHEGDELALAVFTRPGEAVVTLDLGSDPQNGCIYSLFVALSELPGGIPAHYELAFWIGEIDPEYDTDYRYWDGQDTKRLIPNQNDRRAVLNLVRVSVEEIVRVVGPQTIMTQTCTSNLPERALEKYHEILDIIKDCGYSNSELEPYHGRRAWLSERLTG